MRFVNLLVLIILTTILGLEALHNSGWVHADLNDGNIIICRDGTRLADLELASREGEPRAHDYEVGILLDSYIMRSHRIYRVPRSSAL